MDGRAGVQAQGAMLEFTVLKLTWWLFSCARACICFWHSLLLLLASASAALLQISDSQGQLLSANSGSLSNDR
jgi:hypothetical protein